MCASLQFQTFVKFERTTVVDCFRWRRQTIRGMMSCMGAIFVVVAS